MHHLAKKFKVLTQKGKSIVLYINGNYWGIYNLRERIDIFMIAKKEGAKPEEMTILEVKNIVKYLAKKEILKRPLF